MSALHTKRVRITKKKRGVCLVLLLGILAGTFLTGCGAPQETSAAATEAVPATQATQPSETVPETQPEETRSEIQSSHVDTAAEGFNRISFDNFENYEIWQDTQDGSLHFVSLKDLVMVGIVPVDLYNSASDEIITTYSIELVHEFFPQHHGQYLPNFTMSFADREQGYCSVDFGGKVTGLYGFSCNFAITTYDDALNENCTWYVLPLGSMFCEDFLGYNEVSVEYSELDQMGDAPNSAVYLESEPSDEYAGFVVMPMELGAFSINYDSVILYFSSLEALAEYLIPQWEAFAAP